MQVTADTIAKLEGLIAHRDNEVKLFQDAKNRQTEFKALVAEKVGRGKKKKEEKIKEKKGKERKE